MVFFAFTSERKYHMCLYPAPVTCHLSSAVVRPIRHGVDTVRALAHVRCSHLGVSNVVATVVGLDVRLRNYMFHVLRFNSLVTPVPRRD